MTALACENFGYQHLELRMYLGDECSVETEGIFGPIAWQRSKNIKYVSEGSRDALTVLGFK